MTEYFKHFSIPAGVENLPAALTINEITKNPALRYTGLDASGTGWAKWTYGEDLSFISAGTDPDYNTGLTQGLGPFDDSVKFNTGDYYQAVGTSFGNIGTDDVVFEAVARSSAGWNVFFAKMVQGVGAGYRMQFNPSGTLYVVWDDGIVGQTNTISGALVLGNWYHIMVFGDRSGFAQIYINGVASGSADSLSAYGSFDSANKLTIGAESNGASKTNVNLAYLAMWHGADWLDTHLQADLALDRCRRFMGTYYPQTADGTAEPTTFSRSSTAYLDKYNSATTSIDLYSVPADWIRMSRRIDADGNTIDGALIEPSATNLIVESEDFGTTWALIDAGDTVTTDTTSAPDGRTVADSLTADSTDGNHGVSIAPTLTATTHTFSVHAEPGDQDWIKLENTTVANCSAYFDISNGTVGTEGSAASGHIEGPFTGDNGGFYRCMIVFTGTAAAHTLRILSAPADNDDTFAGDGSTKNTYLWGAQCEAYDYATSQIVTDGGTATRAADNLIFEAVANIGGAAVGEGVAQATVLIPDHTNTAKRTVFSINDGTSSNRIEGQVRNTQAYHSITFASGGSGGTGFSPEVITDNKITNLWFRWQKDAVQCSARGVLSTEDTDVDMPAYLNTVQVGAAVLNTATFKGLISNLTFQAVLTDAERSGYRSEGDVLIYQSDDDGEINYTGGLIEMSGGLATSAYLSLFGGNVEDDGIQGNQFTWWGNLDETEPAKRYVSRTQNLLESIPGTSANLVRVQGAVEDDLQWMLDEKVCTEINVQTAIPTPNRIEIFVQIVAGDETTILRWIENWKAA